MKTKIIVAGNHYIPKDRLKTVTFTPDTHSLYPSFESYRDSTGESWHSFGSHHKELENGMGIERTITKDVSYTYIDVDGDNELLSIVKHAIKEHRKNLPTDETGSYWSGEEYSYDIDVKWNMLSIYFGKIEDSW